MIPRRVLPIAAGVLFAMAVAGAAGAYPRYNRIVFGAPPLAAGLLCVSAAGYWRSRSATGRRTRGSAAVAVSCAALAAATLTIWVRPSLAGGRRETPDRSRAHVLLTRPADRLRAELFAELQPVEIADCGMARFGDPQDGGYLMCANLLGSVRTAYSYGIGGTDRWGCDVAARVKVPVHQYDCFDQRQPVCAAGRTIFHAECVAPAPLTGDAGRVFDTIERHIAASSAAVDRLVVKMDVEGAEWDSLLRAPASVLERIDQLAIELHGVGEARHVAVVRRLKEFFHVADVHFNNYVCAPRLDPFPAWAYNVLFVSKRVATASGPRPPGPHPLQTPNEPSQPDCQAPTTRWRLR